MFLDIIQSFVGYCNQILQTCFSNDILAYFTYICVAFLVLRLFIIIISHNNNDLGGRK